MQYNTTDHITDINHCKNLNYIKIVTNATKFMERLSKEKHVRRPIQFFYGTQSMRLSILYAARQTSYITLTADHTA